MNWARTADGMAYVPKHRADRSSDDCSLVNTVAGPNDCPACASYDGRHRAEGRAVTP